MITLTMPEWLVWLAGAAIALPVAWRLFVFLDDVVLWSQKKEAAKAERKKAVELDGELYLLKQARAATETSARSQSSESVHPRQQAAPAPAGDI